MIGIEIYLITIVAIHTIAQIYVLLGLFGWFDGRKGTGG